MSYPPPPPGSGDQPYDPNQQGGYGQPGGYGQAPPPGGYGQQTQDHPKATTSMILGIVGIVCCSFAAPFAWVTGKKTVNEIDASGGRLGGRGQAQAGYILGIVGTVLLILGVLFFILAAFTGGLSFEAGTDID